MHHVKKKEGRPLPETQDMRMWKQEYESMSEEDHKAKLRELGLADEEMGEFLNTLKEEKMKKKPAD